MPVSLLFWTLRTQHKMPMPSLSCVFPFFLGPFSVTVFSFESFAFSFPLPFALGFWRRLSFLFDRGKL